MSTPPPCPRVVLEFGIKPEYRFVLKANYNPPGPDYAPDSPDLEIERQDLDAMGRSAWRPIDRGVETNLLKYAVVRLADRLAAAEKRDSDRVQEIDSLKRQFGTDHQTLVDRIAELAELRVELDAANEARAEAETSVKILQKELERRPAREEIT